jgi:hypothetical protein
MRASSGPTVRIAHHAATEARVQLWEVYYVRATGERVALRWFTEAEPAYDYARQRNAKLGRPPWRR